MKRGTTFLLFLLRFVFADDSFTRQIKTACFFISEIPPAFAQTLVRHFRICHLLFSINVLYSYYENEIL
jgi:hypothetical protein